MDVEGARFRLGEARGHYESWFVRGNHPSRPLAFWFRYTVTSPAHRPQDSVAELFAIVFDGERGHHHVAREKLALSDAMFPSAGLDVRIGGSRLTRDHASGSARGESKIAWDLHISGGTAPLLLLPENLYAGGFPRAKSVVMRPNVTFRGNIRLSEATKDARDLGMGTDKIDVTGWTGSVNHNWGERHTDRYAWGQVAGFSGAPDSFLEVISARIAVGPLLTPAMTPLVLRWRGREYRLNKLSKLFGRARVRGLEWSFKAKGDGIAVRGVIRASPVDMVTLYYTNPPGGQKLCINTKIGACELDITSPDGNERLYSPHGAAFELLVDKLEDTGVSHLPPAL